MFKLLLSGDFQIGILFGILIGFLFAPLIRAAKKRLLDYLKSIW